MPRQKKQHLKRRKDGRYCCRYAGLQFMGRTEEEALAAREEFKQQELLTKPEIISFKTYSERWLESYKAHLTTGPYNTHVRNINRFIDTIGNKNMTDIVPSDISAYYQLFAGMSSSSIAAARDTIKGICKAALADGVIDRNPAESITPPRGVKGTHREISKEERVLIHQTQHRLRPAVMIMLYAGLRRGEALALDIDRDIDFQNMTVTVREAVRFNTAGQPEIVRPKTQAGIRNIPLLPGLAAEIKPFHGHLCVSASGKPMSEASWIRAWQSYLYALGEKMNGESKRWAKGAWTPVEIRPHDLRHSFCTMLYDSGVDLKTAMLWMGHADQAMTMRIYTHLTETRRKESENAFILAQKNAFGMQNGMQIKSKPSKPLVLNASSNKEC